LAFAWLSPGASGLHGSSGRIHPPPDAHKAEAAKKLEIYNARLLAQMIEKRQRTGGTGSARVTDEHFPKRLRG
jgi:hypothetical protein